MEVVLIVVIVAGCNRYNGDGGGSGSDGNIGCDDVSSSR